LLRDAVGEGKAVLHRRRLWRYSVLTAGEPDKKKAAHRLLFCLVRS
jgi:hypothetical protein